MPKQRSRGICPIEAQKEQLPGRAVVLTPIGAPWCEANATNKRKLGVVESWSKQKRCGYANFDVFEKEVLLHQKDLISGTLEPGTQVEAFVHQRRDGRLQGFRAKTIANEEERLHQHLMGGPA